MTNPIQENGVMPDIIDSIPQHVLEVRSFKY